MFYINYRDEGWRPLFNEIDKDHDGFVNLKDLRESCNEMKINILELDQKSLLTRSDLDRDGKVSFNDFLRKNPSRSSNVK